LPHCLGAGLLRPFISPKLLDHGEVLTPESDNATLCGNCSKALQKPLVCDARPPHTVPRTARCTQHTAHSKRGGLAIKAFIACTNTNVTERVRECSDVHVCAHARARWRPDASDIHF
jgi:hypothetical protein